jgi:hypothetical protein
MSQILTTVMGCLTGRTKSAATTAEKPSVTEYKDNPTRTTQEIADTVLAAIYSAEKPGRSLELTLQDIVSECGWTESLAAAILNTLELALKEGAPMGQAVKDAYETTVEAAEKALGLIRDFEREHPILFWSLVALGILAILAPWALEALGFAELGPVEGTCAF